MSVLFLLLFSEISLHQFLPSFTSVCFPLVLNISIHSFQRKYFLLPTSAPKYHPISVSCSQANILHLSLVFITSYTSGFPLSSMHVLPASVASSASFVRLKTSVPQASATGTLCFSCHLFIVSHSFNCILYANHSFMGIKLNPQRQIAKNCNSF